MDNITVWKYTLPIQDECEIQMPLGAEVLSAHMQDDSICIWVKVDKGAVSLPRTFYVTGTGQWIPMNTRYIGTCVGEIFVWHVWEKV